MDGDVDDYPDWYNNTVYYLNDANNSDVNVVMWSWCGQVDDKYADGTLYSEYLEPMALLESTYPNVKFVYMTGHLDHWDDANNKEANDSIRRHCLREEKILYDFADIESYDPDGNFFQYAGDDCSYYLNGSSGTALGNWATEWRALHTENVDWYNCGAEHSDALNANLKAYAVWAMFVAIANNDVTSVSAWPTAAGITYGDDLSSATLSGGTASVAGSFAYDDITITPNAGTYSASLTFTPTDATNYNTVSGNIDVMVAKSTPTVTAWPTAAGITYGDDLSSAILSGGTASVAGSFAYDDNTITPNTGTYSAALIFTPTDVTNYNTVSGNIDVVVAKSTPTVSAWPTAASITDGDNLSSATLSGGTASVAGSFAYDDNTITPNAGTYSAALTFTPTDATNYNTVSGNIDVVVTAPPTVTTQTVSSILTTTATGNGNITDLGTPNPTAHGVCWNTGGTPTTADDVVDNGAASTTGAFTASMSSLTTGTLYHVRAFATNSAGTRYGSQVSFTTDVIPTIAFNAIASKGLESLSSAVLQVDISATSASLVTVDYAVTGTAAGSGIDYALADGTFAITAGNTTATITIASIVDDAIVEGDETVIVSLSNPGNATLGTNTVHTYTITDNDTATNVSDISISNLSVYPNPCTDNIYIANESNDISYIIIHDLSGQTVLKANYKSEKDINVSHLTSGLYLLMIVNNKGEKQMIKIVKE